jgi:DNA-binding NarL/FixJ family response regulator
MKRDTPKKVLIADDSHIVRERLVSLLADLPGVDIVGEAETAFEAIQSIRRRRPDVVILDISMPGGSGIQVLETIRKDKPVPLIIMLTNFTHEPYRQRCLKLGADYFFDKSNEFEKVKDVLENLAAAGAVKRAVH